MQSSNSGSLSARRTFLARFGAGVSMLGAAAAAGAPAASAQAPQTARWQPARHAQDDWLDEIPGQHRLVFDTTTPGGANSALLYAGNYFLANRTGYNLQDQDLAVVIILRHFSTPFAFTDAIWEKYGASISRMASFTDPKTGQAPTVNVHAAALDSLLKRGVHLAVCQMATRALAGTIARDTGAKSDDVFNEIAANLMANSHLVPAGIVAVDRAQERGYALVHAV